MNQDITVVMNQKRSRFVRAEVVVCIDTADELVFALNCNDRDLQIGEFAGGECMGEDILSMSSCDSTPFSALLAEVNCLVTSS